MAKTRTLTKEKVVLKSVQLANELGDARQLSLKAVAAALNIKVPSLYNHINGQDGLLRELRLFGLREQEKMLRLAVAGKTGRQALLATAVAYRVYALRNRGIYLLTIQAVEDDIEIEAVSAEIINTLLLILGSIGLAGDAALHAVRGLRSLLHGFISLEISGGFALKLSVEESFERLITTYIDSLAVAQ